MGLLRSRAVTGRAHFRSSLADYARRGLLRRLADRAGVRVPSFDVVAPTDPLPAILHRDQWVVICPDCGTAAFVWPEEPLMLCAGCFNGRAGGAWRRVAVPAERATIEEIVGHRPLPDQRNWIGESLADLRGENDQNGDSVPGEA